MSELVCFRLQLPSALEWLDDFGVPRTDLAALAPLHFSARTLDSGGELRGKIKL